MKAVFIGASAVDLMMIIVIATLTCVVVVLVLAMTARGRAPSARDAEELTHQIQTVDVFELLALADELAELRRSTLNVPGVKLQHRVVRAQLLDRVKTIAANAAIVLRIAQCARHKGDARAAELADQMINDALSVRLLAFTVICRLHTMWLFGSLTFRPGSLIFFYQRSLEHLSWLLGRRTPVAAGAP